jgi:hypothetical protein
MDLRYQNGGGSQPLFCVFIVFYWGRSRLSMARTICVPGEEKFFCEKSPLQGKECMVQFTAPWGQGGFYHRIFTCQTFFFSRKRLRTKGLRLWRNPL